MRIRWYGQSAFLISGDETTVFIDPFGDMTTSLASRGLEFSYPPIDGVTADLVLVTHEHRDHNAVEVIGGDPVVLRSTAGTLASPVGEVVAVASEHDDVAGTKRGPNTVFCFTLDGVRISHFGDFGQGALRPEQCEAIGEVDVLLLPVGDGPTVGGERAAAVVRALRPRLVVPHHYKTDAISFLEPPDAFLEALGARVERPAGPELVVDQYLGAQYFDTAEQPLVALLDYPRGD